MKSEKLGGWNSRLLGEVGKGLGLGCDDGDFFEGCWGGKGQRGRGVGLGGFVWYRGWWW